MKCVFCAVRGQQLGGSPIHTAAAYVINGISVCDLDVHIDAAALGNVAAGVAYIKKATEDT